MDQTLHGDFVSCPEGVRMPNELWKPGQPNNNRALELCSVVDLSGAKEDIGLDDIQCLENVRMLCQVNYSTYIF